MFPYTAGRWLHLDKQQHDARYVKFDFDRLCEKILSLYPSATSIKDFQKIEGGFSKVFIIRTDNDENAVVKLPTSVAGSARHITNSEVATIMYLKSNTEVPIPNILDWDDDPANPIGSAYIIMEHAGGILLQEAWANIPSDKKIKCIGAICTSIVPITKLDFSAYGSLYFANASFIDDGYKLKLSNNDKFCIGPHCRSSTYWNNNVGESRYYTLKPPNRGPWHDLSSYASALIDSGLARLPPANQPLSIQQQASYQGSIDRHMELLKIGRNVFPHLVQHPEIQSNSSPTLFHPDLHKRNIFISQDDPTIVTGIIDWQGASIEPAFYYADEAPDFAKIPAEGLSDSAEESLRYQAYEIGLALLAPRLGATRKIDEALLRPFRYCHRTWRDGFVPFTHELMRLKDSWERLGFEKECPIPAMGPEEKEFYEKQLEIYDGMLEFRRDMFEVLGVEEDGWVPAERWEEAKKMHQGFYDTLMDNLEDDESRQELRTMWPFDQCQPETQVRRKDDDV
ncbi:altered inheritance of mitochondria protein 9 [Trichophyton mentagrophytes]|nr:altered inheritance of mitochondria protein 9 [Trichophyton mentagrophytes]